MDLTLKANRAVRYAGRSYKAGDVFTARTKQDARLLVAVGMAAEYVPPPVAAVLRKPEKIPVADVVYEGPAQDAPAQDAEVTAEVDKPKRYYKRRDMTAE